MNTKDYYKWIIQFEMKQNTSSMALRKGFNTTIMDNKQSVGSLMEEGN
jgi:hypothetical protein